MTTLFTVLGVASALAFGLCNLPQILRARKRKSTGDISLLFILLSLLGNICAASYIIYSNIQADFYQWPQYLNYAIATTLVVTLLTMKIKNDGEEIKRELRAKLDHVHHRLTRFLIEQEMKRMDGYQNNLEAISFILLIAILTYLFFRVASGG